MLTTNLPDTGANGQGSVSQVSPVMPDDGSLSGMSREFRGYVSQRLAAAKRSTQDAGLALAEQARRGARATDAYVHARPWTVAAAGAAAGLLVGALLARRLRAPRA